MAKLESRISNWTDQSCIADIFLNHVRTRMVTWHRFRFLTHFTKQTDFLLDYEMYMANFNASKEVLEYLLAHREDFKLQKEVARILRQCYVFLIHSMQKFECGQQTLLPLASFLILPIQRIPRYELFLKVRKKPEIGGNVCLLSSSGCSNYVNSLLQKLLRPPPSPRLTSAYPS